MDTATQMHLAKWCDRFTRDPDERDSLLDVMLADFAELCDNEQGYWLNAGWTRFYDEHVAPRERNRSGRP